MLSPQKVDKIPPRDLKFSQEVRAEVRNLDRCYQCSMCSDGCPVAYAMDYHPNEIIYMTRMGLKKQVLQSKSIWVCVSCHTCATRCPNEVEIVHLMDVLRGQALKEKAKSQISNVPQFHQVFVQRIRKRGRVDTVELILNYELRTFSIVNTIKKIREHGRHALEMFRKGKLKLPFRAKRGQKETEKIFRKVLAAGKV